ncbi:PEP-CTERM sorting domain-containing protein [Spirulina subsalsa FACHB-351]|uniref:PEP-CTERM sorting domain-containing protein n=1 Tax=Spirulina subsalsa FACHB-351 TaxID=234711 RepID=A0ABT3L2K4_9CYAN|nr:PEP-CTERM sorting domain-containing protein [Spirulina subsalsa]MCW6035736.1 PEP-CTERM sorting domain-containing protein [Spirulina subsalsa FACHB-351]
MSIQKMSLTASLAAMILMGGGQGQIAEAATFVLYDGTANTLPSQQGELAFGAFYNTSLLSNETRFVTTGEGGATLVTNAVGNTLVGSRYNATYAGYSNYSPFFGIPVNSDFPTLDTTVGFTLSFNLAIHEAFNPSPNEAGFSVLAIADNGWGIELGFTQNSIFSQSGSFTAAQTASYNTSGNTQYDLQVLDQTYRLLVNGTELLMGELQQYGQRSSNPLPFNPYAQTNYLFLGDNSPSSHARVTLFSAQVDTTAGNVNFGGNDSDSGNGGGNDSDSGNGDSGEVDWTDVTNGNGNGENTDEGTTKVPEPSALLGLGAIATFLLRKRFQQ